MNKFCHWGVFIALFWASFCLVVPCDLHAQPFKPDQFYIMMDGSDFLSCLEDNVGTSYGDDIAWDEEYIGALADYGINLLAMAPTMNGVGPNNPSPIPNGYRMIPNLDSNCANLALGALFTDRCWYVNPVYPQTQQPDISFLDRALAYKPGLSVMLTVPEIHESETGISCDPYQWTYNATNVAAALAYFDHPVLKGYGIGDELNTADAPGVAQFENHVHPTGKFTMANHYPSFANAAQLGGSHQAMVLAFMNHPSPGIYCEDYFPYSKRDYATNIPCDHNTLLYIDMDFVAREATARGIAYYHYVNLLYYTDCPGAPLQIPVESFENILANFNSAMAYGYKGIAYFRNDYPSQGYNLPSGLRWWANVPMASKLRLKTWHEKLIRHSDLLMDLAFEDCFHKGNRFPFYHAFTDTLPARGVWNMFPTNAIAAQHFDLQNIVSSPIANGLDFLAISFLHDSEGGQYFWVYNKSPNEIVDCHLNFNGPKMVLNVLDDAYCPDGITGLDVLLDKGEARLFQISNSISPDPVCTPYASGQEFSKLAEVISMVNPNCHIEFQNGARGDFKSNSTTVGETFIAWEGSEVIFTSISLDPDCGISTIGNDPEKPTDVVDFKLYPNPSEGSFNLEWLERSEATVTVTDIRGALVFQSKFGKGVHVIDLQSQGVAKGMYIVVLESNRYKGVKKVVVQ